MRFFLSVKRAALLGIFISIFIFTNNAHSQQPPSYGNNQRTLKVDKRLLDTDYDNAEVLGHISDFTPEQLRELFSKNKGNKNVPIVRNNNVSSSSSFDNKTPRKLGIDDFVFPIALLIFISIMSIPISLLWRFGLKVPASLFIITTAGISCSMLLLLAFG
ncbi:hypothetical protein [Bartonella schoenbuchensis]|uniref:Uncharacterized protein n=1 Tax=Bartonella schoenbuchensis (strain DSM 13525 / NCTC 13165 / R1) TaxID=687861 RepID=E6Z077_BARSR|nr:hypothetical protein [Bartonella schoenbuchensis]AQX30983.1 hypothetical protein BscR1v2_010570 [Bartonella schoenbuchensis R1]CBI82515.1 exported hypothetical protein [Bartonella schoenbuchensis R1]